MKGDGSVSRFCSSVFLLLVEDTMMVSRFRAQGSGFKVPALVVLSETSRGAGRVGAEGAA